MPRVSLAQLFSWAASSWRIRLRASLAWPSLSWVSACRQRQKLAKRGTASACLAQASTRAGRSFWVRAMKTLSRDWRRARARFKRNENCSWEKGFIRYSSGSASRALSTMARELSLLTMITTLWGGISCWSRRLSSNWRPFSPAPSS
ncbi:hypothetical protein D3C80_1258280 [compost metagenome]